jgi:NADH-quinone oxidoreductase subunit N
MIGIFSTLFFAALVSIGLHRTRWLKPFAIIALTIGAYFIVFPTPNSLIGFTTSSAIALFELILLIVVLAIILHEKEDLTITQTLFMATGSIALLEAHSVISFVVSFEVVSILSFVLVSHIKNSVQAQGAIKLFIAGSIATGLLLLGTSLYLIGGGDLLQPFALHSSALALTGIFMMLLGVFYKLTIVPMHAWAADTYAQVRPSHAAILSGIAKTVVALATFRLFSPLLSEQIHLSLPLLVTLSLITMTLGNFLALFQQKIGRILAYSSIAHAGYLLLAFAAVKSGFASTGLLYMAIAYIFMQTAVFLILDILRNHYGIQTLEDLKGFAHHNKLISIFFTVQLFSLAGIPLLAGFMGKAVVFYAAVDAGLWYAVLVALLNSALSVGYYGWIIKHLYFDPSTKEYTTFKPPLPIVAQSILLVGTLFFGIFASYVFGVGKSF